MKVIRCLNGHYFDSDKYSVCPHCGTPNTENAVPKAANEFSQWGTADQLSGTEQYADSRNMGGVTNNEFKTPNMNVTPQGQYDFPQTVYYGHRDDISGKNGSQTTTGSNGSVGSNLSENVIPSQTNDEWRDADQQKAVSSGTDTVVLNAPVMPSLGQNWGVNSQFNGYGVDDINRFRGANHDETEVLSSVTPQIETGPFLTQVSTGYRFSLTGRETVVGKISTSTRNDISVDNSTVSRRHACIYNVGEKYFIEDLGSTNKTHINGIDIGNGRWIEIKDNDKIVMSNEEFVFSIL
ncbi:MAG: FHA domain-containing protein [Eubacterium sp.]|nr:FHA domain-containing protein [Eubacterium sp.]